MLLFIDESGDPGFKLAQGASSIFAAAMVIFNSEEDAAQTQAVIENSKARKMHKSEFKFSKCSSDVRDLFFDAVRRCPFIVRAIVIQKEEIHSLHLKSNKESFYQFFVKEMMKHDDGVLQDAKVIIDGSGDRLFRKKLNTVLRSKLNAGVIQSVRFKDSKGDVLIQLADMCVGAIARSYRDDREEGNRWRQKLAPRIDDVWEFK
jgi:hypothetical protein